MAIYLETERLILRDWQDSDADAFVAMNMNPAVRRYFPDLQTREESLASIEKMQNGIRSSGYGFYALALKGPAAPSGHAAPSGPATPTGPDVFVGFTGLKDLSFDAWFCPCVEIGWRLDEPFWGKGYATEAARACLADGFTRFGLDRIYAFTALHNAPSERVMQRIGMEKLGTFPHPSLPGDHPLKEHLLYRAFSPSRKTNSV